MYESPLDGARYSGQPLNAKTNLETTHKLNQKLAFVETGDVGCAGETEEMTLLELATVDEATPARH